MEKKREEEEKEKTKEFIMQQNESNDSAPLS